MKTYLLLTCSLLGLLACTTSTVAVSPPTNQGSTANPAPSLVVHQLREAQALWEIKQPAQYTYTLKRTCFCPPEFTAPIEAHIVDGTVRQAISLMDNKPLPAERMGEAETIGELFGIIDQAVRRPAESIQASYDPDYGFPASMSIDMDKMIADEEIYYSVTDFKAGR